MTKIQWTNESWNPFAGCSKISAGCKNCYAIRDAVRLSGNDNPKIAKKYAGTVSANNWTGKINLASEDTLLKPLRWTRPRMIFVNSMSDLFHDNVPEKWIDKVFEVMYEAKKHTFQILTKRPERMLDYISKSAYLSNNPLPNVWLGVSVEDQKAADERIPLLLQTPAAIRWISAEPLLEKVELEQHLQCESCIHRSVHWCVDSVIDWVVVGGESGDKARVCNVDWIRSIVQQCQSAQVAVFVKQLGANSHGLDYCLSNRKGGDSFEFPVDLQVREYPGGLLK